MRMIDFDRIAITNTKTFRIDKKPAQLKYAYIFFKYTRTDETIYTIISLHDKKKTLYTVHTLKIEYERKKT